MKSVAGIFDHFETLTDPRLDRNNLHFLRETVVVALCTSG